MNKQTSAAPGGREREHHTGTKLAPQVRKRPGLGEPLVKMVEPAKIERRIPRTNKSEGRSPKPESETPTE